MIDSARVLQTARDVLADHVARKLIEDDLGFYVLICCCGRSTDPAPTTDIAVDMQMGHVVRALLKALGELDA